MFRNGSGKRMKYLAKYNIAKVKRRNFRRKFAHRYKLLCGCKTCGYNKNPYALEFNHIKGTKVNDVSVMVHKNDSMKRIKDEIRKCEVLCANCHAEYTHRKVI
jgi:hypothetical protein